jgi:hypothetical protein
MNVNLRPREDDKWNGSLLAKRTVLGLGLSIGGVLHFKSASLLSGE